MAAWYETWGATETRVEEMEKLLLQHRMVVRRGNEYDRWDLRIRGGLLGGLKLRIAIEEHGEGKQLVLVWMMPTWSPLGVAMPIIFGALAAGAATTAATAGAAGPWWAFGVLTAIALAFIVRGVWESGAAIAMVIRVLEHSTALSARALKSKAKAV